MSSSTNHSFFLEQVRQIIIGHLSDSSFDVNQLAALLSMHRSSLSRKLIEQAGQSPSEMIEELRMEEAYELLVSTDISIAQVACSVGFSELSNFSRAFKRYFGESPSNVRK